MRRREDESYPSFEEKGKHLIILIGKK